LHVHASAATPIEFELVDLAYNTPGLPKRIAVDAGARVVVPVDVGGSGNWYDLEVTAIGGAAFAYKRRCMGRMETGKDTISDPAMAARVPPQRGVRVGDNEVCLRFGCCSSSNLCTTRFEFD